METQETAIQKVIREGIRGGLEYEPKNDDSSYYDDLRFALTMQNLGASDSSISQAVSNRGLDRVHRALDKMEQANTSKSLTPNYVEVIDTLATNGLGYTKDEGRKDHEVFLQLHLAKMENRNPSETGIPRMGDLGILAEWAYLDSMAENVKQYGDITTPMGVLREIAHQSREEQLRSRIQRLEAMLLGDNPNIRLMPQPLRNLTHILGLASVSLGVMGAYLTGPDSKAREIKRSLVEQYIGKPPVPKIEQLLEEYLPKRENTPNRARYRNPSDNLNLSNPVQSCRTSRLNNPEPASRERDLYLIKRPNRFTENTPFVRRDLSCIYFDSIEPDAEALGRKISG